MKKLSKYLLSGLLNTTLSYLAFLIIFESTKSAASALLSGLMAGILSSYLLNRFWIWKVKERGSILRFITFQVALITTNWILLHFISLTQFPRERAQIFIYAIFAPIAYKINELYIFNKRTKG
jgi:putative flippase GtrA